MKDILLDLIDSHSNQKRDTSFTQKIVGSEGMILVHVRCYMFLCDAYSFYKKGERLTDLDYTYSTRYGVYEEEIGDKLNELVDDDKLVEKKTVWSPHNDGDPGGIRSAYRLDCEVSESMEIVNVVCKTFSDKNSRELKNYIKDILDDNSVSYGGSIDFSRIEWGEVFDSLE